MQTEDALDLPLPSYQTDGAAGMDLYANVHGEVVLLPGEVYAVPAGFRMALPEGVEAQIRPRSGLALNRRVTMPNAPGTIDSDYRGEVKALMINLGGEPFVIRRGDRIAQMVVARYERAALNPVAELGVTARGEGGFGSTGVS
jgi:dUTP pyrophosphatase